MNPEDEVESLRRSFADTWPVAPDYEIADGLILPLGVSSSGREFVHYLPMAHPELPGELAKVAAGGEGEALAFVRRYGLLGYRKAWSFEERKGVEALTKGGPDAYPSPPNSDAFFAWFEAGDPLSWVLAHARTVDLVLRLLGGLREGDNALAYQMDRFLTRTSDGSERIEYTFATRGYLRPQSSSIPAPPSGTHSTHRELAADVVAHVVNPNLAGVGRFLLQPEGRKGSFGSLFGSLNLLDCVYWHLTDAATGGWVRRCANPECGAFFVAKSDRVKYCPRPRGNRGVSPCMNRHKQREHRRRQKPGGK